MQANDAYREGHEDLLITCYQLLAITVFAPVLNRSRN